MSDYYQLLTRMVAGLDTNAGESRRALYGRARATLLEQLRTHEPPLTGSEITQERLSLEAAIRKFEADRIRVARNGPPEPEPPGATPSGAQTRAVETDPTAACEPEPARAVTVDDPPEQHPGAREPVFEAALLDGITEQPEQPEQQLQPSRGNESTGRPGDLTAVTRRHSPAAAHWVAPLQRVQTQPTARNFFTKLAEARQADRAADPSNPMSRLTKPALPDGGGGFLAPLLWFLYFVLGFAQLIAFFHGLQLAFGLGGLPSIGIFMLLYLTGSLGSIPMAIIAFYGARHGWQWSIWSAALLSFPFVILSFGFLGIGGFYSFFNRRKTPPLVAAIDRLLESPWWRERARRWRAGLPRVGWNHPSAPGGRPRPPRGRR